MIIENNRDGSRTLETIDGDQDDPYMYHRKQNHGRKETGVNRNNNSTSPSYIEEDSIEKDYTKACRDEYIQNEKFRETRRNTMWKFDDDFYDTEPSNNSRKPSPPRHVNPKNAKQSRPMTKIPQATSTQKSPTTKKLSDLNKSYKIQTDFFNEIEALIRNTYQQKQTSVIPKAAGLEARPN